MSGFAAEAEGDNGMVHETPLSALSAATTSESEPKFELGR